MKILMIGARMSVMVQDVLNGLAPDVVDFMLLHSGQIKLKDGSEIHVATIEAMADVDRLRGLRFDLIVEHPSFRQSALYNYVRAAVLR